MAVTKEIPARNRPNKRPRLSVPANPPTQHTGPASGGDGPLCRSCAKIDFHSYVVPSSVRPFTFTGLSRDPSCPFCSYIRRAARDEHGRPIDDETLDRAKYRIEQRTVPVMDRLRASQMLVAPRLTVYGDLTSHRGLPASNICVAMLELDGKDVTPIWRANAFWTSRRPRGPSLDIPTLQSWLDTARETDKQHTVPFEVDEISLQRLISKGCFRVLDAVTNEVVALSKVECYHALSYVWGRKEFTAMVTRDVQRDTSRSDGLKVCWTLDINRTPTTIRDAMSLLQRLGERFLWVDSICINQDDPEDKAIVIREMRSIYRSAALTIVAAEGDNADVGLRRLTCKDEIEQPLVIPQRDGALHLYPALPSLEETIRTTLWNERGWTYQERILSSACVYFTRDEVLFSSGGIIEREAYVITNNPDRPLHTYRRKTPSIGLQATLQGALSRPIVEFSHKIRRYQEAVAEFTRRRLTHSGDRLDAFTGILALLQDSRQTEREMQAFSGLLCATTEVPSRNVIVSKSGEVSPVLKVTESAFPPSLLWQPTEPITTDQRIRHNAANTRALPSWSWAGWNCRVHYTPRVNGVPDLADAHVLNENNIQLTTPPDHSFPCWPDAPSLSELSVRDAFVLHMWRPVLRCALKPYSEMVATIDGSNSYMIVLHDSQNAHKRMCMIDVADEFTHSRPRDHLYEFVPMDYAGEGYSPRNLMMVRRQGEYFERIALSYGTPPWMEQSQLMDCQHIRLI